MRERVGVGEEKVEERERKVEEREISSKCLFRLHEANNVVDFVGICTSRYHKINVSNI